ncbi:hypothetical protein PV04_07304 [Phialophora macrospora]|uniref:Mid2 domain-containing protein n=1 Tax=Phialophora macrospora TaxID=1851006 RepID=A0A0D2DS90_9EURO|nr:hypothetical protein PV04_07304 [Phialophora macrospora]
MRTWTASFCALPLFLSSVSTQDNRAPDPNNHFISPPLPGPQANVDATVFWSNQNWTVGVLQTIDWNWVTNLTNLMITLQQEGNPESVQSRLILDCPAASTQDLIYWDGKISPIDLKNGSVAYLAAWDCDQPDATPIFFSHYINLTEPVVTTTSSTSTTIPSTSSVSSTTSGTPTSASPVSTSSVTPAATAESNHSGGGGSNSAAIGGGIGGGIGGALVLIVLAALFVYWHRGQREALKRAPNHEPSTRELLPQNQPFPRNSYPYQQQTSYPSELSGIPSQPRKPMSNVELDSNGRSST